MTNHISLLDFFAAHALPECIKKHPYSYSDACNCAYHIAVAMLLNRNEWIEEGVFDETGKITEEQMEREKNAN